MLDNIKAWLGKPINIPIKNLDNVEVPDMFKNGRTFISDDNREKLVVVGFNYGVVEYVIDPLGSDELNKITREVPHFSEPRNYSKHEIRECKVTEFQSKLNELKFGNLRRE